VLAQLSGEAPPAGDDEPVEAPAEPATDDVPDDVG
jgi:hypothetical protein